jgi:hypothetical protein
MPTSALVSSSLLLPPSNTIITVGARFKVDCAGMIRKNLAVVKIVLYISLIDCGYLRGRRGRSHERVA